MNHFGVRNVSIFDKLEGLLISYLNQVERMIEQVHRNVYFLDSVIKEYECLKNSNSRKGSMQAMNRNFDSDGEYEKVEKMNEMSLFYDRRYGPIPLNKDAIEMRQHVNRFKNYRKKYEFKHNFWPKKAIDNLISLVHEKAVDVSCEFLISEDCSEEEQRIEREKLENKTTRELFKYIKKFCEEKDRMEENSEEETCAWTDLTNTCDGIYEAPVRVKEEFDFTLEGQEEVQNRIQVKREQYNDIEEGLGSSTMSNSILEKSIKKEEPEDVPVNEIYFNELVDPFSDKYKNAILEKPTDSMTRFQRFVQIFWNDIATSLNTKHHDASECHKMWLYRACFSNSGDKWEESEIEKLFQIAEKYEYRNWSNIAKELQTNRSPFSCYEKFLQIVKPHKLRERQEKRSERINERRTCALRIYKKFKRDESNSSSYHQNETTNNVYTSQTQDNILKIENNELDTEGRRFIPLEDIQLQLMVSIIGTNRWNEVKEYVEYINFHDHLMGTQEKIKVEYEKENEKDKSKHLEFPTLHQEVAFKRRYKRIMKLYNNILQYPTF